MRRIQFVVWGVVIVSAVWLIFYVAHKDEPGLRAECEAKGGMLIGTRTELYVCVGKPRKEWKE